MYGCKPLEADHTQPLSILIDFEDSLLKERLFLFVYNVMEISKYFIDNSLILPGTYLFSASVAVIISFTELKKT